jgi:tetratricopeptide (TPR) repeat protein
MQAFGVRYFFSILFLVFILSGNCQDLTVLNERLNKATHDTTRVTALLAISEAIYVVDPDTLVPLSKRIIELADKNLSSANEQEKKVFLGAKAGAYNNTGYVYYMKGESSQAIIYWEKSYSILDQLCQARNNSVVNEDQRCALQLADVMNNIASVYGRLGDLSRSLEYHHKSLRLRESAKDKSGIAFSLSNIGFIYSQQKEYEKAMEYHRKSLDLRLEINDKRGIAESYTNIGYIYNEAADTALRRDIALEKALEYYNKSLTLQQEIGDKYGESISLNNIGSVYYSIGDFFLRKGNVQEKNKNYELALDYYNQSKNLREKMNDKPGLAYSLNNIGTVYLSKENYKTAEEYCMRAYNLAKEHNFVMNMRETAFRLYMIYEKTGRHREAYGFYKLYITYRDSLNNEEVTKTTTRQQMQYDFDKKDAAAKAGQEKKDALAAEQLRQQKMQRNYFIAGFLLVLLLAVFILRSFLQKKKANRQLEEKNVLIAAQKQIVEEKQKEILDSIYYARRIQQTLIPSEKYISKKLRELRQGR